MEGFEHSLEMRLCDKVLIGTESLANIDTILLRKYVFILRKCC